MTELKEKIIRQSKQMFWDYGLKRVGIDDICNELHISKKTFYTVFKTKKELIEEILKSVRIEKKQMEEIDDNDNIIEYLISKTNTFRNKPRRDDEKFFQIHFDMKKYYSELFDKHCRLIKEDSEVNTLSILNMGRQRDILQYGGVLKCDQNTVSTHDGLLYGHYVPRRVQRQRIGVL